MSSAALRTAEAASLCESHRLGMAEMGYAGLSEQWLMRRAGDLHWQAIAGAMGQEEAVFRCATGTPLYAAFCATRLTLWAPRRARLGGRLDLVGRLRRVGRGRLGSIVDIVADDEHVGEIALISAFVGRGEQGGNRGLARRAPRVLAVPPLSDPALDHLAHRAVRVAGLVRGLRPEGDGTRLLPCPSLDFNAAGLLYFPSFAALAEREAFMAGADPRRTLREREVAFLGNVEPGEAVTVHALDRCGSRISLLRGQDGRALATMRTRTDTPDP